MGVILLMIIIGRKIAIKKIFSINILCDYEYIKKTFQQDHYQNGMFFCRKDNP